MARPQIRVTKEDKAFFEVEKKRLGIKDNHDVFAALMAELKELRKLRKTDKNSVKEVVEAISSKETAKYNTHVSGAEKADIFFDAVKNHNEAEADKGGLEFIYLPSKRAVLRETGVNSRTDTLKAIGVHLELMESHYEQLGIRKDVVKAPHLSGKDEKGRVLFIGEVLRKAGVAAVFGR